jgi:hypothetical protein
MTKFKTLLLAAFMLLGFTNMKAQQLTPNDKIELSELVNKWALFTDAPNLVNLTEYMNLWSTNNPVLTNPFGTFNGIDAIKKWQQSYNVQGGPAYGKRHSNLNIISVSTGKNLAEITFDLYLNEVNDIPTLVATGRTKVVAVKENGIWKIQSYIISVDAGLMKALEKAKANK